MIGWILFGWVFCGNIGAGMELDSRAREYKWLPSAVLGATILGPVFLLFVLFSRIKESQAWDW